jgi:uncharacterized protein (UPF0548 family)
MAAALKPRWSFRAPTDAKIRAFLDAQHDNGAGSAFSYAEVGASRHNAARPLGYDQDHNRIHIGTGLADFEAGAAALRAWRMFPTPWTRIAPANAPIEVGETVAMQAHALGLWWLNACRIVYVIDERGPLRRFGFAYGTLLSHVEQGEERFSVELHPDDSVWYDLRAFSRPRYWPVRLGRPLARRLQARFVRESQAAMRWAVADARNKSSRPGGPVRPVSTV